MCYGGSVHLRVIYYVPELQPNITISSNKAHLPYNGQLGSKTDPVSAFSEKLFGKRTTSPKRERDEHRFRTGLARAQTLFECTQTHKKSTSITIFEEVLTYLRTTNILFCRGGFYQDRDGLVQRHPPSYGEWGLHFVALFCRGFQLPAWRDTLL